MSAPGWALGGIPPPPLFNVEFATGAEDDARNSLRHTPTLKRGEGGGNSSHIAVIEDIRDGFKTLFTSIFNSAHGLSR